MTKKLFFIFSFFIFLSSCGYTPMYSSANKKKINIQVLNYEGDSQINSRILSRLKIHNDISSELYEIIINTDYKKTDLSKNLAGEIQSYQLKAVTKFEISGNKFKKNFEIIEVFTMQNFTDDFKEMNYEKKIKNNIGNAIYQKLIIQLTKLK
tara:strand:+ start:8049 stop:8504 length:456 start_codon:yes stop_codon:yes gene_type:complete